MLRRRHTRTSRQMDRPGRGASGTGPYLRGSSVLVVTGPEASAHRLHRLDYRLSVRPTSGDGPADRAL